MVLIIIISKFVSLEENEIWRTEVLNASKKIGSKCFESCKTSLIFVPRIETLDSERGILTCHYEFDVGDNYYEMAYVDGPTNWIQNSKESVSDNHDPYGLLPNSDIVLMKKEPKFVIIDGRRSTIKYCLLFDRFKKYSINLSNKYQTLNNNYQGKDIQILWVNDNVLVDIGTYFGETLTDSYVFDLFFHLPGFANAAGVL